MLSHGIRMPGSSSGRRKKPILRGSSGRSPSIRLRSRSAYDRRPGRQAILAGPRWIAWSRHPFGSTCTRTGGLERGGWPGRGHALFVLSGFLITTILVGERAESGTIDLRGFYGRRVRRLLPALVVFLAVTGILFSNVIKDFAPWASTWPGLFYVSNYAQIFGFDVLPNTHLWSLSVEEHFYAVWPLMILTLRRMPSAATLLRVAAVMMCIRIGIGTFDQEWAYYGTEANSYALLIGCAIAVARFEGSLVSLGKHSAPLGTLLLVVLSM